MASCFVVQCIRHLMGQPLYCSAAVAGVWGERGYGDGSTHYTWLSNITLPPWLPSFPPQAIPITISSLTFPQSISPQSTAALTLGLLHTPQTPVLGCCTFQGTLIPVWSMYGCGKDYLILIPFRPQISCVTLSLKCFSSDSDNCPHVGIGPLLQFPHPPRAGLVLLTLLFFPLVPSCYRDLCGSIYSFPLVRYSCLLSTDVLHVLLCLKVYSWGIRGERCTPRSPTPLPSVLLLFSLLTIQFTQKTWKWIFKGIKYLYSYTSFWWYFYE